MFVNKAIVNYIAQIIFPEKKIYISEFPGDNGYMGSVPSSQFCCKIKSALEK